MFECTLFHKRKKNVQNYAKPEDIPLQPEDIPLQTSDIPLQPLDIP